MNKLTETAKMAKAKATETKAAAKRKAEIVYERGRGAAAKSAETSREAARTVKVKSSETINSSPLAVVAGGLALGAILAALLPKSEREQKVLGKTGKKINDRAKQAVDAAKQAGKARMEEVGLSADTAREQFKEIFGKATEAAKAAGEAARDAAKKGS
jgi:hypothetical protein